eukprot:scaffold913_cov73-Phaeocystis_antarctica.AAC.9
MLRPRHAAPPLWGPGLLLLPCAACRGASELLARRWTQPRLPPTLQPVAARATPDRAQVPSSVPWLMVPWVPWQRRRRRRAQAQGRTRCDLSAVPCEGRVGRGCARLDRSPAPAGA